MSNQPWEHEYHVHYASGSDEAKKWWDVRKPNSPFPNYFIVEDVGDPNDGDHLVSLLNEREQLIDFRQNVRKVLGEVLGILPELPDDFSDVELPVVDLLHIRGLLETWIDK